MSQKLQVDGFKWIEDCSECNEDFIKSHNEKSHEGYFLEADVQFPENLCASQNDLLFLPEQRKLVKTKTCS